MRICRNCGATLPDRASFCGVCGQEQPLAAQASEKQDAAPAPHALAFVPEKQPGNGVNSIAQRQGAELLFGRDEITPGPPPGEGFLIPPGSSYPIALNQFHEGGGSPTIPVAYHNPFAQYSGPHKPLVLPQEQPMMAPPGYTSLPGNQLYAPPSVQRKRRRGWLTCLTLLLLILFTIGGTLGIGLAIFKPSLSLQNTGPITPGGQFQLHGSSFIPGDTVTLTLDHTTPLYYSTQVSPIPLAQKNSAMVQGDLLAAQSNSVTVSGDSTFDVTIPVGNDWRLGLHSITASEGLSPRNATLSFTIVQSGQRPQPTTTPVPPTGLTPTPSVGLQPTPPFPDGTSGVSNVIPGAITLGPLQEGSNQTVSTQVTLNTGGADQVSWTATWDQDKASWLQLDNTSGQIQAPAAQILTVSAQPGSLRAGTYTTTINFTSDQNTHPVTLKVTFIIQPNCLTVTPSTLTFTATMGTHNPSTQSLNLTSCNQSNTWTATISDPNTTWLSISPQSGSFSNGKGQKITVTASLLNPHLDPGTYQGTILISSGPSQISVPIAFTVLDGQGQ